MVVWLTDVMQNILSAIYSLSTYLLDAVVYCEPHFSGSVMVVLLLVALTLLLAGVDFKQSNNLICLLKSDLKDFYLSQNIVELNYYLTNDRDFAPVV